MIDWDKAVLGPLNGVFGEPAWYMPTTRAPLNITGIFDEAYRDVDLAGGMGVTSAQPVLGVQLSQFRALPEQGDRVTITRTKETFIVKEVRDDGHGSVKLMLNLVS